MKTDEQDMEIHTDKVECGCICHKVGLLGFFCCPCSPKAIQQYIANLEKLSGNHPVPSKDGKIRTLDLRTGKKMQQVDEFYTTNTFESALDFACQFIAKEHVDNDNDDPWKNAEANKCLFIVHANLENERLTKKF